jgi:hypothetical protein
MIRQLDPQSRIQNLPKFDEADQVVVTGNGLQRSEGDYQKAPDLEGFLQVRGFSFILTLLELQASQRFLDCR